MSGYGNDKHVEALAQRLHRVHPDGEYFGLDVMRSLAQMALVSGANPMPGANGLQLAEDENGRPYMMFGYAYWNNQVEAAGGMMWEIRPRPMTDMERMEWGVPQNKLAWICAGALYRDVKRLRDEYHAFGQNDVTLPDVRSEAAVVGIGVADESVQQVIGRTRNWVAEKRARTDLCRKLLPEVAAVEQGDAYGDVDEGRLPGWYNELVPDTSDAPQTETVADINDLLFGAAETRSKQPPASKTADSKPKGSNEPQTRSEPTAAASSPTPPPTDRSRANGASLPPAHDPTEEVMRDFMADVVAHADTVVSRSPADFMNGSAYRVPPSLSIPPPRTQELLPIPFETIISDNLPPATAPPADSPWTPTINEVAHLDGLRDRDLYALCHELFGSFSAYEAKYYADALREYDAVVCNNGDEAAAQRAALNELVPF